VSVVISIVSVLVVAVLRCVLAQADLDQGCEHVLVDGLVTSLRDVRPGTVAITRQCPQRQLTCSVPPQSVGDAGVVPISRHTTHGKQRDERASLQRKTSPKAI
jgi:hypothetical protein